LRDGDGVEPRDPLEVAKLGTKRLHGDATLRIAENQSPLQALLRPRINTANVGCGLALLRGTRDSCSPLAFWDPQYDELLRKLAYGNRGVNRGKRRHKLPLMSPELIKAIDQELVRVVMPSGYVMRWIDEFGLLNGLFKIDGLEHVGVIHWDKGLPGTGGRVQPVGGSLIGARSKKRRRGVRGKDFPVKWKTKPMFSAVHHETVRYPRSQHVHKKPVGLVAELIRAITEPGDIVIDPAAGDFTTMHAALGCHRRFLGTDLIPWEGRS
jgi:site-specific DNA-methyltransferase (adenine-specific)